MVAEYQENLHQFLKARLGKEGGKTEWICSKAWIYGFLAYDGERIGSFLVNKSAEIQK